MYVYPAPGSTSTGYGAGQISVVTFTRAQFDDLKNLAPAERGQNRQHESAPGIGDDAYFETIPGETYATLYVRKGNEAFQVQIIEPQGTTMAVADKEAKERILASDGLSRL